MQLIRTCVSIISRYEIFSLGRLNYDLPTYRIDSYEANKQSLKCLQYEKPCCIANYYEMLMFYIFNLQYISTVLTLILKQQSHGTKVGAKIKTDKNVLDYLSRQHWFEYPLSANLGMCNLNYAVWSCLIVTLNSKSRHLTGFQTT